ncbi:hypothetical protein BJ944DRAFT_263350, partial [Cunninghamella echinulata]
MLKQLLINIIFTITYVFATYTCKGQSAITIGNAIINIALQPEANSYKYIENILYQFDKFSNDGTCTGNFPEEKFKNLMLTSPNDRVSCCTGCQCVDLIEWGPGKVLGSIPRNIVLAYVGFFTTQEYPINGIDDYSLSDKTAYNF